jgi:dipeptidyl aminopeptidase/acylaminoacyl peptidase
MTEAHYGSWRSPITADLIVSSSVGVSQPRLSGDDVYWIESRPTEAGRNVIVHRRPDGTTSDVNPPPFNARTRVHEYGGGDYLVDGESVYFANFADQRLYVARPGAEPVPLTHTSAMRYADPIVDRARNRLICVREDHTLPDVEPVNAIAAIDLASGKETVLVEGHDFYAYPRLSPDGSSLAWIHWDHPNMPWDGTELVVGRIRPDGAIEDEQHIAGSLEESVTQPEWSPDGSLYFISDRRGWWNLYRWAGDRVEPMVVADAEFARPMWQFGASSYAFDGAARILCTYGVQGTWSLASLDTASRALTDIETPFTDMAGLRLGGGHAVFIAGSPSQRAALVSLHLAGGDIVILKASSDTVIEPGYLSQPEAIEFPTEDGLTAFGFYYPPRNLDFEPPFGEKPPLLVMSHGGPTSATSPVLSPRVQYWTSRGIAVLDVNYGGSTGYGRDYRERLKARWGIVDVDDSVNGARHLVDLGLVDGNRLAITGGSAGGYTTLSVLAFREAFHAGASHYGVSDLETLATDTHKFESRYLDSLIGPYPERRDLYVERSPIHHIDRLNSPVIFFQGLEDKIVPPDQAQLMFEALRDKSIPVAYVPFEGEQHGFRRAENIKRSLEGELYFYGRIFNFNPADPIAPVPIENL